MRRERVPPETAPRSTGTPASSDHPRNSNPRIANAAAHRKQEEAVTSVGDWAETRLV